MKLSLFTNGLAKERGGILIESLVSLLVMGIIGGGIMHTTARVLNAQRDAAVTNVVVNELRPLIMSRSLPNGSDLCAAGTLTVNVPGGGANAGTVTKQNCTAATITIKNDTNVVLATVSAPQPVVLSVGSDTNGSLVSIGGTAAGSANQ